MSQAAQFASDTFDFAIALAANWTGFGAATIGTIIALVWRLMMWRRPQTKPSRAAKIDAGSSWAKTREAAFLGFAVAILFASFGLFKNQKTRIDELSNTPSVNIEFNGESNEFVRSAEIQKRSGLQYDYWSVRAKIITDKPLMGACINVIKVEPIDGNNLDAIKDSPSPLPWWLYKDSQHKPFECMNIVDNQYFEILNSSNDPTGARALLNTDPPPLPGSALADLKNGDYRIVVRLTYYNDGQFRHKDQSFILKWRGSMASLDMKKAETRE